MQRVKSARRTFWFNSAQEVVKEICLQQFKFLKMFGCEVAERAEVENSFVFAGTSEAQRDCGAGLEH